MSYIFTQKILRFENEKRINFLFRLDVYEDFKVLILKLPDYKKIRLYYLKFLELYKIEKKDFLEKT